MTYKLFTLFGYGVVLVTLQRALFFSDSMLKGYTCSLAASGQESTSRIKVICDDRICAQCVKTRDDHPIKWTLRDTVIDAEDLIAQGYICGPVDSNYQIGTPDVEVVCDDGSCAQCTKSRDLILNNPGYVPIPLPDYDDETTTFTSPSGCKTQNGVTCVFPFIYKGVKYSGCTTVDNRGTPWCSTKTDKDGVSYDYGLCAQDCPLLPILQNRKHQQENHH